MTAKEFERTKKWRDMAVIARPDGIIGYQFPITKKVLSHGGIGVYGSWCNGRSRESLIVGERMYGMNFSLLKPLFGIIAKLNVISFSNISYLILIPPLLIVQELCEQDCEDDTQIDLDVPRTISEHIFFRRRYGAG